MSDETSPGPWRLDDEDVLDANRRVVARAHWSIHEGDGSAARWAADARLIAAAPEMLALLRHLAGGPLRIRELQDDAVALIKRIDEGTQ